MTSMIKEFNENEKYFPYIPCLCYETLIYRDLFESTRNISFMRGGDLPDK